MLSPPPRVYVQLPEPSREYATLIQKTTLVYNQLLADKSNKLINKLVERKLEYDRQCGKLDEKNGQQALEYGLAAQEQLNKYQNELEKELHALHEDYQQKLTSMLQQLEDKWRKDQGFDTRLFPRKT